MATANNRKTTAVGASAKKPRAAGARAAKPRATAASMLPAAAKAATARAKAAVKPAAKAKKPAPAKKLDTVAKMPAAKKAPARKPRTAGEARVVKQPAAAKKVPATAKKAAAAKAPRATAAAPRTAKARAASKPQAPAVLTVASMRLDTSLAAQVAAKAILQQARTQAARRSGTPGSSLPLAASAPAPRRQSALLRELRESVSKPPSHQLDNLLSGANAPQGPGQPTGRQSLARRQAGERKFEPHAGYYGVPRRAAG